MKKLLILVLLLLSVLGVGLAETDWKTAPEIVEAYEVERNVVYLEWTGNAQIYRIDLDGKQAAMVNGTNSQIPVKGQGRHHVTIYPANVVRNDEINTDMKLDFNLGRIGGLGINLDLASLGIDPKKVEVGTASKMLDFELTSSELDEQMITDLTAQTDEENRAVLLFTDYKNADEYILNIRMKESTSEVVYSTRGDGAKWISREGTTVRIVLDPEYLIQNSSMVPRLEDTYTFCLQLRKQSVSFVTNEPVSGLYALSKKSNECKYTLKPLWKTAPVLTYASQTADGQVELTWAHEDYHTGCEYGIYLVEKALGIKTGEKLIGTTDVHSFVIHDLMNGKYTYVVVPILENNKGDTSAEVTVEVRNDWVSAPLLQLETLPSREIRVTWQAGQNIDAYLITVYEGDAKSLLKYANMDFVKKQETELTSTGDTMEFLYACPENVTRLKFEVVGTRHAADGSVQKSAVSTEIVELMEQ